MNEPDATEFAEMALAMHDESGLDDTLERAVEYAQQAIGCDHAGVMMLHGGGRVETAVATDPIIEEADRLQRETGEGPCVQAIWSHDSFIVDDSATDPRWPVWGSKVAALGLRSMLSIRLFTLNSTLGALNLYSVKPSTFDDDDLDIADIFGRHVSVALATARQEDGLREAIGARHLIGQAQGMLMERYGLDADRAFAVLRRYSRDNNVKLRTVARRVIASRRLPDEP